MVLPRLSPTEYSVGWVCALPIELAAAQAMLDEKHAEQPPDNHDPNLYTLGRIGNHNVVLICLPAGQVGIGPAAAGATRMLSKFRSIRFGLMVGVGGGVPSAEVDIRLGDVAISQPHNQHGGVVQYDYGKTGKDGHMTRTGSLSPPPKALLSVVSQLRANRHLGISSLAAHLTVFDQLQDFSRQTARADVLFEATYNHSGDPSCERCSRERIVQRKARKHEEEVMVHYGTIASGSQVMKDGVTRDRLSAELGGVLCFEMEAAGLMNDFPCLVVRGICDYADSHKNKVWQPYAAATAAACAKEIMSLIPAAEVAVMEAVGETLQPQVPLSLQGVPVVSRFVHRDAELKELERLLPISSLVASRRNVVVVHGLGGIGKTQLAVEFARRHQSRYSGVFWLDGSTETSVKQSFTDMMRRLPRRELAADGVEMLKHSTLDVNVAVRECLQWLSLPSNHGWLLIFDNVDRDFYDKNDSQAYNVKSYFPYADHGSILITSRLASLQKHGSGVKVGTVATEQARAILEMNAGREAKDATVLLERLNGLPLALTQAGSYIRETNLSATAYAGYYDEMWEDLMKKQGRFPLEEYKDRNVLTTWIMSYEQVQRQSEEAAGLLKLWGFLDCGELWYGLVAAILKLREKVEIPAWLLKIAESELEFVDAVGLLSRYSLIEATEGSDSYSMHAVLHKWCSQLVQGEEKDGICSVAAGIVAWNVPSENEVEFWTKQKRIIAHGVSVSRQMREYSMSPEGRATGASIQPWVFYNLGFLLSGEDRREAEKMYLRALQGYEKAWGPEHTSTLMTVNNLGVFYASIGKLDKAEEMYQRALQGKEQTQGLEHTSTLNTVNSLGILYADLGKLDEAEKMYQRALQGYERALGLEHRSTLNTVNNLGILYAKLGKLDRAEEMYQRALQKKEKVLGLNHTSTLNTVNNLGSLYANLGKLDKAKEMYQRALQGKEKILGLEHTSTLSTVNNLGDLYAKLGRLDKAEEMYQRAFRGYEKALPLDYISTYVPALDNVRAMASLSGRKGHLEDARVQYSKALLGFEKVLGKDHRTCQTLREKITALGGESNEISATSVKVIMDEHAHVETIAATSTKPEKPASEQQHVLQKLGKKRKLV
ncbi:hypothetical protein B0J11DRAFT_277234 [Dendryphion nanum]|uniref:Orc1-like AAA ATPase domain-containing protein n=1 Tax=Dendryphion nanum TaxID=256645 RepID=A0A9P9E126_9PLEO|nr:hypothetical protein B0J11DRAFT_277234 [Dendryphion nanum]